MQRFLILIGFTLFCLMAHAQSVSLVTPLPNTVWESSGLIQIDHRLITHNDSGDGPFLYEVDTLSGMVTRVVTLSNANHKDWEDICHDSTYIYVADFGNNSGSRTDLRVYRLSIADYLGTTTDSVTVDTIQFNYADQTDFTPSTFSTNFDAEGIISFGDSLYIFTKNWGNFRTNVYALPKLPGNYSIQRIDSIDVQGLITGATYSPETGGIMLCGYTSTPFLVELTGFIGNVFSSGVVNRMNFSQVSGYSIQVEGIVHVNANRYYLTAENSFSGSSGLFVWDNLMTNIPQEENTPLPKIYPNPTSNHLYVECDDFQWIEVYDFTGKRQLKSLQKHMYLDHLESGMYWTLIQTTKGMFVQKLMVQH